MEALFLGSYFVCAALALPLWLRVVPRLGLARTWLVGMVLSMAVFIFATQLGAGDTLGFVAVCVLSGVALGTDLALPGALLAGTIAAAGDRGPHRRRLLWLVELCHQAQPRVGCRCGAAACWACWVTHLARVHPSCAAGAHHRVLPAALRPESR